MKNESPSIRATPKTRKRILVIDDEPEVTRVVLRILQQNGFDGWAVNDPLSISTRIAEMRPDVIILDFALRHITGPEVAVLLKKDPVTSCLPIIFLSGMADQDHRDIGALSGGAAYLAKPIDQVELLKAIQRVLAPSPE